MFLYVAIWPPSWLNSGQWLARFVPVYPAVPNNLSCSPGISVTEGSFSVGKLDTFYPFFGERESLVACTRLFHASWPQSESSSKHVSFTTVATEDVMLGPLSHRSVVVRLETELKSPTLCLNYRKAHLAYAIIICQKFCSWIIGGIQGDSCKICQLMFLWSVPQTRDIAVGQYFNSHFHEVHLYVCMFSDNDMASGDGNSVKEEFVKEKTIRSPVMKWLNPRWYLLTLIRLSSECISHRLLNMQQHTLRTK